MKIEIRNEVKELEGYGFLSMWRRSYYFSISEKKELLFLQQHGEEAIIFLAVCRRSCCFCTRVKKKLRNYCSVPVGRRTYCFFSGNVILKILFSMQCEEEAIVFVAARRRSYCFSSSEKKKIFILVAVRRRGYLF